MGYEITIKLDDAASERVTAVTSDLADFRSVDDYVNALIQRDAEDAFQDPAVLAELRAAFAVPDEDARPFDPTVFRARMRQRHG